MSTDKTLADVQPGGRVRLGDGLPEAVAQALATVNEAANDARHAGNYKVANALVTARITLSKQLLALSAQPSPGGQGDARRQWLEIRGLAAAIVKNLQAFADSPHKAAWCGALDDSLLFADQIEKAAAAAYEADLERRRMA